MRSFLTDLIRGRAFTQAATVVATLIVISTLTACSSLTGAARPGTELSGQVVRTDPGGPGYDKVLLIVAEDRSYSEVMDNPRAPYLKELADTYGTAVRMDAGYPVECPGLPAYLLLTSGDTHGICDSRDPSGQWLEVPNIFDQVARSGLQWRGYAESMPRPCTPVNTDRGLYLVRHSPATYYSSERRRCPRWQLPLGTLTSGALHDDLANGLPAFGIVTPNACNNWQGLRQCRQDPIPAGDAWLRAWVPRILQSPDYTSGRLAVIITWDEGSSTDNHIATVVISPTTKGVASARPFTHCSTLRTIQELLGLPLIGCAAGAPSMRADFGL